VDIVEYQESFQVACFPGDRRHCQTAEDGREALGKVAFSLTPQLASDCRELARRYQTTESKVLAAGLRALFLRYEGRTGEAPRWTLRRLLENTGLSASVPPPERAGFAVGVEHGARLAADLVLSLLAQTENRTTGIWRFRRDLFESEEIVHLDRHYCRLLAGLVANPDNPISEPGFLSEAELDRAVHGWNDTHTDYPRNATIPELFAQIAVEHADTVAIVEGSERITYRELDQRSNGLASHLRRLGVESGARIGLALDRSISMVISMLAVLKAGCAYVPLDSAYPADRLRFMISDTDLAAIITDKANEKKLSSSTRVVSVEEVLGGEPEAAMNLARACTAESTAYIMYTSGSTGTPKGVEVPHRAIVRLVRSATYVDFGPAEVFAQISNSSFDAITFEVWGALLNGARLVILPTTVVLSPEAFADAIQKYRLTAMFLTSSLFNLIAARCPSAFHTVRHLLVGGDAVDPRWARQVLETAPPRRMINGYGPTECTTFSVTHDIRDVAPGAKCVPIGRPLSNSQAFVLDWNMQPAPAGVSGELYLGGDGLAKGYWNRPEITAERFVTSPFDPAGGARLYKTGDLARYQANGVIECLGRTDHQVKIRGFRIELGEIETVLRRNPGVADCAVLAEEDASGAKTLRAYVAAVKGTSPSREEIRRFLGERLPEFMLPASFAFVDELPFSANGKVDRAKLRLLYRGLESETPPAALPTTAAQLLIAGAWKKVLGVNGFGVDDNFFDIGGNSLLLAAVECELRPNFATPFTITDLFEHPTVRALAARLTDASKERSLVPEAQERARRQKAAVSGLRKPARARSARL
jgi:amino acid adenylation domain-containing protein